MSFLSERGPNLGQHQFDAQVEILAQFGSRMREQIQKLKVKLIDEARATGDPLRLQEALRVLEPHIRGFAETMKQGEAA